MNYCQNNEEEIIKLIFDRFPTTHKYFYDLGAGDGEYLSNTKMLRNMGWKGEMFDIDNRGNEEVKEILITTENILELITKPCTFLSIDLDGNDYWILKKIVESRHPNHPPMVICCEINSQIELNKSITIKYDSNKLWDGTDAYGMSYLACFKLLMDNNYTIVHIENNTNIFAIANTYLNFDIWPEINLKYGRTISHPEGNGEWIQV